ncbi:OB-fold domain-containing protein (plasmid) [Paraburkholderia sprentiae WSM5005]|uniref:OB-fold domain-containing protein n=1 Tax=Paraburkholderia sprentiae WSM5005 TaxID=754502 RepID=A0A1I9YWC5_9BURK|nr:OB-fold domain-containing protein [Paraburkholderia sprentiae]APA90517.2 OB-fold domain-containing protein [Paraburkholderia sprentiae WSM5005]
MSTSDTLKWKGPLPTTVNETQPFWDACNRGQFLVQRCNHCGEVQYHYRAFCCHCWSDEVVDLPLAGTGKVWTFSIVKVNRSPQFADWGVYATGLVEVPEGVKIISRILTNDLDALRIGSDVRLAFAKADSGQQIPVFVVEE